MKVYLAGPLFTAAERDFNKALATELKSWGYEVWLPQENEPRELTAQSIFDKDVEGVLWSDVVVANMDGPDPDSGTYFECGLAYGLHKPVISFRTDYRGAGDIEGAKYNLMLWASSLKNIEFKMGDTVRDIAAVLHTELWPLRQEKK